MTPAGGGIEPRRVHESGVNERIRSAGGKMADPFNGLERAGANRARGRLPYTTGPKLSESTCNWFDRTAENSEQERRMVSTSRFRPGRSGPWREASNAGAGIMAMRMSVWTRSRMAKR